MELTKAAFWLAVAVFIGIGVLRLLQSRIDAAIDRNLPDPRWY
jgi:hypothetical protein